MSTLPEVRQLRYFAVTAEELHFGRAAERLHLAQPALSQSIQRLEQQLGVQLFERDRRSVRLTAAGKALLPEARRTVAQAERAATMARRAGGEYPDGLVVGFLSTTVGHLLPPIVRATRERIPEASIDTREMPIAALVGALRRGELDAGITRPPLVDDLASETIMREPAAAVLPEGHPLADRESLRLSELAGEPWVLTERSTWPPWHRGYDVDYSRAGFEPDVVQRGSSVQNVIALVAAGAGVSRLALSSRRLYDEGVVFVPLEDDWSSTVVVWSPGDDRPLVRRFVDLLREMAPTLGV
jgi:DNA-binding transcriptional LysR family regulator